MNAIYVRKRVGTHQKSPRKLRTPGRCRPCAMSICTRLVLQAMRNSPATQASSSREVVKVCARCPVTGSVFADIDVRKLSWNGRPVDGAEMGVRDVFMGVKVYAEDS